MSTTRSKKARKKSGAARKGSPYELRHDFRVGDRVRIIGVPENLKNTKSAPDDDMKTPELFRACLGRSFLVRSFDRYGYIELHVDEDKAIREFGHLHSLFGRFHSIWIEPEHLELVSKSRIIPAAKRGTNGTGWKTDRKLYP